MYPWFNYKLGVETTIPTVLELLSTNHTITALKFMHSSKISPYPLHKT